MEPLKKFDRRTYDRYVESGIVSQSDFEKFIKNLPDDSAHAQWVQMDIHDTEISEDFPTDDSEESDL